MVEPYIREVFMADVSTLQSRLDAYLAAEAAILGGAQSYTVAGRTVTKAQLPSIQSEIRTLEMRIRFARGNTHWNAVFGSGR